MICVMFSILAIPFKFRYFHYLVWPTDCEQLYLIRHAVRPASALTWPTYPVSRVADSKSRASLQAGDPGFSEAHGFPEAILHKLSFLTRSTPLSPSPPGEGTLLPGDRNPDESPAPGGRNRHRPRWSSSCFHTKVRGSKHSLG